jgi:hypothetical protein
MTRFKHKIAASVPAARRDSVNAELNRVLVSGPDTFWIPMVDAVGRIIRYGTQWRMTTEEKAVLQSLMARPANQGDVKENERIDDHAKRLGLTRNRKARE